MVTVYGDAAKSVPAWCWRSGTGNVGPTTVALGWA